MNEIQLLKIDDLNNKNSESHFYANTISGHLKSNHSRIEKHHKHNFFAVFLFTVGSGIHEIDFNVYDVKPGTIFFLYPGQTHLWELSENADGFLFFHSEEFYETGNASLSLRDFPFFESNQTEKCFYLKEQETHKAQQILETLLHEYQSTYWNKKNMLVSLLSQLYIHLSRWIETKSEVNFKAFHQYQSLFSQFENLLNTHFRTIKNAQSYAEMLHISQKHLNRIVKSVTGKTTTTMITERILLEAKRELVFTNKTVAEIAASLAYDDASYFHKLFKKHTNETPYAFLKRNKNITSI